MKNIEYERKYTIDLSQFYEWAAQPHITCDQIQTQLINQWYVPEKLSKNGVLRIRVTTHNNITEPAILTIKVPTLDPAVRSEFEFVATTDFSVDTFVNDLDLHDYRITKDRWNITGAFSYPTNIEHPLEIIVDFMHINGQLVGMLEVENPPDNWVPPSFVVADVTDDMSYTNYAIATNPNC